MEYGLTKVKGRLKVHLIEFKICYFSELGDKDVEEVNDDMFKVKREIVYASDFSNAKDKLAFVYEKCALINDLKLLRVCDIK